MKNIVLVLIIFQFISCVSTKNEAESRNRENAAQNNFELFRFWYELDILRFNNDILKIKIVLISEDKTISDFEYEGSASE